MCVKTGMSFGLGTPLPVQTVLKRRQWGLWGLGRVWQNLLDRGDGAGLNLGGGHKLGDGQDIGRL